jgi:hypothetical protein
VLLSLIVVIGGAAVAADEPTATPTPAPTSEKGEKGEKSLSDVAGDIKLNKNAAKGGGIVISNENLSDYAGEGRLTEVTKAGVGGDNRRGLADVSGTGGQIEGEQPGYAETMEKKQHWQMLYGRQLEVVRELREQIEVLDYEIPGLWRDFYSWDDPMYRDGVIKPKLDQALAQRQKLEVELQDEEAKLAQVKEAARRDGAQPGWFRGFDPLPTPKPTVGVMPP